jgi:hypothetical protein
LPVEKKAKGVPPDTATFTLRWMTMKNLFTPFKDSHRIAALAKIPCCHYRLFIKSFKFWSILFIHPNSFYLSNTRISFRNLRKMENLFQIHCHAIPRLKSPFRGKGISALGWNKNRLLANGMPKNAAPPEITQIRAEL